MTDKEFNMLDRINMLTEDLQLADVTKDEALEALKNASFNEIADELWTYYCFVCDIKGILRERRSNDR